MTGSRPHRALDCRFSSLSLSPHLCAWVTRGCQFLFPRDKRLVLTWCESNNINWMEIGETSGWDISGECINKNGWQLPRVLHNMLPRSLVAEVRADETGEIQRTKRGSSAKLENKDTVLLWYEFLMRWDHFVTAISLRVAEGRLCETCQ